MIYFYYYYENGEVVMTANGSELPQSPPFPTWTCAEGVAKIGWWVNTEIQPVTAAPRPFVDHGWTSPATSPVTLHMAGLPAGSVVTARNEAGESVTTDDPADPIILVDPETYQVSIEPPWPYMPETLTIEVT